MIHHGDCLEILPTLPAESIDSIVTDPPYGLSFMGKNWDHGIPGVAFWSEALRVAKPGTHLLAFGGTRTFHRLTVAIEDAGWEIRDCIMWVYGSGFPKSHNLSGDWQGWGTALKPAWEPIIVARKPLAGTVAQNVQEYGTGAVNVDGCRIGGQSTVRIKQGGRNQFPHEDDSRTPKTVSCGSELGRWPANLIHDGSDEVVGLFPETGPAKAAARGGTNPNPMDWGNSRPDGQIVKGHDDNGGSAARFFYCAKASKADRDEGLDGFAQVECGTMDDDAYQWRDDVPNGRSTSKPVRRNHHPTVKPNDLMRYLCRLVTPPGGTVLDPFCGSGSTGKAATMEGFGFVGIEREAEYVEIARARIAAAKPDMPLLVNA